MFLSRDDKYQSISQFYEALAKRVSTSGHVVDLFAGCLDQVGLLEMKSLPNSTNGVMVLSDAFTTSIFKQSFLRVFTKDEQGHLEMGFNATFDVQVSLTSRGIAWARFSPSLDYKRTQGFRFDWTCYVRQQKIRLCRRNGDWYRSDISVEHQCYHA